VTFVEGNAGRVSGAKPPGEGHAAEKKKHSRKRKCAPLCYIGPARRGVRSGHLDRGNRHQGRGRKSAGVWAFRDRISPFVSQLLLVGEKRTSSGGDFRSEYFRGNF